MFNFFVFLHLWSIWLPHFFSACQPIFFFTACFRSAIHSHPLPAFSVIHLLLSSPSTRPKSLQLLQISPPHSYSHMLSNTHTHTHVSYTICSVWDCIYVLEALDWFCLAGILLGIWTVLIFNIEQKNGKWAWEVCVYFYLPPFGVSPTSARWGWNKRKNNRMRGINIPTFVFLFTCDLFWRDMVESHLWVSFMYIHLCV